MSDIRDESGFKIRAEGDQGVDQGVDDQGVEGGWWWVVVEVDSARGKSSRSRRGKRRKEKVRLRGVNGKWKQMDGRKG